MKPQFFSPKWSKDGGRFTYASFSFVTVPS
jgi:hypothetical protein